MAIEGIGAVSRLASVTTPAAPAGAIDGLGSSSGVADPGAIGVPGAPGSAEAAGASSQPFADALGDALAQLNTQLVGTDAAMADFAAGGSSDLHTVMLQMQEASIGLRVGIQVRDRLLEAYQEVMRLQL